MAVKKNKMKIKRPPQKPVSNRAMYSGGVPDKRRSGTSSGRAEIRPINVGNPNTAKGGGTKKTISASQVSKKKRKNTTRAVNRAMNSKSAPRKKRRRRYGSYILYYLLAGVIVVIVFIILANTLLFNCSSFEVEGSVRYTDEEIVGKCGINIGDNLLHIDTKKAEEALVGSLAYIDMAQVSKVFPTKIKITITEAEKWFCVEQDGVTAAVSRGGKIVEHTSPGNLPVIIGFEAQTMETGSMLASNVHEKDNIPSEILNAAEDAGIDKINSIDITDRFDISLSVDNRITLELGSVADVRAKFNAAKTVIEQIASTEMVSILLTDPEKVAVSNIHPESEKPEETKETTDTGESGESAETGETKEPQTSETTAV